MQENTLGKLRFLSYPAFDSYRNLTNVVTTRSGGLSDGHYTSMNLALHVGDSPDIVLQNRALVAQALGFEPEYYTVGAQVHGSRIRVVRYTDRGKGSITEDDALDVTDAMVTNGTNIPLMVLVADCVALSFYDPTANVAGLAHAGWQGTLARISQKTIRVMERVFGSEPKNIIAGVSPSIGKDHYDVGREVHDGFAKEFGSEEAARIIDQTEDGTCRLDLWSANKNQLLEAGIPEGNIDMAEMCTACHPELFYSHRHENGTTGRFAAVVMLHAGPHRTY